jgi:hypothetical protein
MGLEIKLDYESVDALRVLAKALPQAVQNIGNSTDKIMKVYETVEEEIGPHSEEFKNILNNVKKSIVVSSEAVLKVPVVLERTADKIEDYLNSPPSSGDS